MPEDSKVFEFKFYEEWQEVEDFDLYLRNKDLDLGIIDADDNDTSSSIEDAFASPSGEKGF